MDIIAEMPSRQFLMKYLKNGPFISHKKDVGRKSSASSRNFESFQFYGKNPIDFFGTNPFRAIRNMIKAIYSAWNGRVSQTMAVPETARKRIYLYMGIYIYRGNIVGPVVHEMWLVS